LFKCKAGIVQNDKKFVTLVSVVAAVFLTGGKLVAGLLTGSLALLSEAAHSGLDFLASILTFFAVRVSDKPADFEHTYGHGKVENLTALVEAGLLSLTCVWIVYEALKRIFVHHVHVEVNVLAFVVVISSIVIDLWRSTALRRVAKKYNSQALEADALNFTTDLYSSAVVLLGLLVVKFGPAMGLPEPSHQADAVAALIVTVFMMSVTWRLGKRAVDVLMDRAPAGIRERVEKVARGVEGVTGVHSIRVRPSGNRLFIDLHVMVPRNTGLEPSHRIGEAVEAAVEKAIASSNCIVHVDPSEFEDEKLSDRVRVVAANHGVPVHSLSLRNQDGKLHLDLDLEVDARLSLEEAHAISKRLEQSLRAEIPEIHHVHTHIEPRRPDVEKTATVSSDDSPLIKEIRDVVRTMPGVMDCHAVEIERAAHDDLIVSLHCTFPEDASIEAVHRTASAVERELKAEYPSIRRVLVHTEPGSMRAGGTAKPGGHPRS
jgi:cation diffusion facilitator family transporter